MAKKTSKNQRIVTLSMGGLLVIVFIFSFLLYSKRLVQVGVEKGRESSSVLGVSTQIVDNGVTEIKSGKLETAQTIPNVFETQAGIRAVCINVEVRNISGMEQKFIPLEEIKLVDSTGQTYDIAGVLTCAPGLGGPIQVGEVLNGKLGFFIPDNATGFELHYIPLNINTKSVIISNI